MSDKTAADAQAAALRERAEARSGAAAEGPDVPLSTAAANRLVHELRVHQIELEMQNEELRSALVELDASRERYFDLYDLAPVGYLTTSARGLVLEANLTAAGLLGERRSTLIQQPLSRFLLPEDLGTYFHHRARLLETAEPQAFDVQLLTKGGVVCWARLQTTTAKDAAGATLIRVAMSNVSKHKQVERQLQDKAAQLEAALIKLETMAALLPVCGRCKRLRGEDGEWRGLEATVALRSKPGFQPAVCEECRANQSADRG